MEELRGILVAMETPFTEDGQEVDWGGLSALVDSPPGRTPLTALLRDGGSVAGHRSVQAVEG